MHRYQTIHFQHSRLDSTVSPIKMMLRRVQTSPAHQIAGERCQREKETDKRSATVSLDQFSVGSKVRLQVTHSGVGLPNVLRNSPFTWFCGER